MGTVIIEYEGRVLATVDERIEKLDISQKPGITSTSRITGIDRLVKLKKLDLKNNQIQ
nr:hypothetical protein [Candidatus Sigynarchaeota archaeon]